MALLLALRDGHRLSERGVLIMHYALVLGYVMRDVNANTARAVIARGWVRQVKPIRMQRWPRYALSQAGRAALRRCGLSSYRPSTGTRVPVAK